MCFRGMEKGATGDWQHPVGGIEEEEDDEEDDASADASPPPKKKRGARKQAPWKDPAPRAPPKAPQPASIDMTGWDSD